MARQQSVIRKTAFGQLDELTRELAKLALVVNARFIADASKLKELKTSSARPITSKKRISRT
jgi:hypothetical protein